MKKNNKNSIWTMVIAIACIAMLLAACSNDDNEVSRMITKDSFQEEPRLFASGYCTLPTVLSEGDVYEVFTEDDIVWFDLNTRELRFHDMEEPLYQKLRLLSGIEFRLGNQTLFSGSTFVGLICSQVFNDLVLCCGKIEDGEVIDNNRYYLYDCYPNTPQFLNDEQVKANREKRAEQWETFTRYLDSKGKLRK
jgi:hypothetical protein